MSSRWFLGILAAMGLVGSCKSGGQSSDAGMIDLFVMVDSSVNPDGQIALPDLSAYDLSRKPCWDHGHDFLCQYDSDCGLDGPCQYGLCCRGTVDPTTCVCLCNGVACDSSEYGCCAADPGWEFPDGDEVKCRPYDQCGPPGTGAQPQ